MGLAARRAKVGVVPAQVNMAGIVSARCALRLHWLQISRWEVFRQLDGQQIERAYLS
ncbi:hypothetical protein X907_1403 [Glycocaulis alkaliphilus]|uniref:Uncharacterized protein n=1 Tax=Glycocaulis alkaliphilus TaxID=1434191 RepID=A0A3T0E9R5_9PROT|nr:hypothetical protein X907_1403 [Glycocaulis alkaliphilus]